MILQILSRDVHGTAAAFCAFNFLDNFLQIIFVPRVALCKHLEVIWYRTKLIYRHFLAFNKDFFRPLLQKRVAIFFFLFSFLFKEM